MTVPYILTDTSASIFIDFTPYVVPSSHPNWTPILEALNDNTTTEDDLLRLLDVNLTIASFLNGAVEYRNRAIYFNGSPINTHLTRRILQHLDADLPGLAEPLVEFLKNVMLNPSRRAVQGLYEWVERSGLPITPDGYVLAYKIVNDNFTDCYTGSFDNSPGQFVEVARNEVDEDPDQTCSFGLHVCSPAYLPAYGPHDRKVVVVKVHPKDFVAVPRDYNTAKARVSAYLVLKEIPKETAATFFPNAYVYDPTPQPQPGQVWRDSDGYHHRILRIEGAEIYTQCLETRISECLETRISLTGRVDDLFEVGGFYEDNDGDLHRVVSILDNEIETYFNGDTYRFNRSGGGFGEDAELVLIPN